MEQQDRRDFLKQMGVAAGALAALPYVSGCAKKQVIQDVAEVTPPTPQPIVHKLPDLAYGYDALAPSIGADTMEIHHSKHHAGYVTNLNNALEAHPAIAALPLPALLANGLSAVPDEIRVAVRNNGGGHLNHSLFWKFLTPNAGEPSGAVVQAIIEKWSGIDEFKTEFKKVASGQFGSGWGWLVLNNGALELVGTPEQDTPWSTGKLPLLGVDVWEHAYYLNYENRRGDYIDAFFEIVNWDYVNTLFAAQTPEAWVAAIS